jgi:Rrf2 family protein
MKLTKRGEYALRALIDLGIAHELGFPRLQIHQIATKENMPVKFLEAILVDLKEGGYLDSRRGRQGGYFITKPLSAITLGEVIRDIEGPLAPIRCVSLTAYEPCSCPDEAHCGLRMVMLDVRNAIAGVLDHCTLASVVEVTLRNIRRDNARVPFLLDPKAPRRQ